MLFCMALTTKELVALLGEILRVLRPGGLCVYTARNTADPDFGRGIHRGEALYENQGFIIHFFDRAKVDSPDASSESRCEALDAAARNGAPPIHNRAWELMRGCGSRTFRRRPARVQHIQCSLQRS